MSELSLNRIKKGAGFESLSKFYGVWLTDYSTTSYSRNKLYYPLYLREKTGQINHTVRLPTSSFVSDNICYGIWDSFRNITTQQFNNDKLFFGHLGLFAGASNLVEEGGETRNEFVAKTDYVDILIEEANNPVDTSLNAYSASGEYIGRLDLTLQITRNTSNKSVVYIKIDWKYTGQTTDPSYLYLFPVGDVVVCGEE